MADYSYLNNVPARRIHKRNAKEEYENAKDMISWYQRKILALTMCCKQDMKDEEGNTIFWPDFVINELDTIFEDYNDQVIKMFLSRYIIDCPEDVDDELERLEAQDLH